MVAHSFMGQYTVQTVEYSVSIVRGLLFLNHHPGLPLQVRLRAVILNCVGSVLDHLCVCCSGPKALHDPLYCCVNVFVTVPDAHQ